ncbi:prion-inhibition and propagation-domain-containing protein [Cladorrhinum sp. PSN259]|nr:prion-inhibition and propagation-domain-containing protein [Cladorrhinum sp. PSN259]
MAEVAGLVLGAVGIVGVIGAFKDAVDLFNVIADSRYRGRDYEILDTKLDIERTLMLQWAARVKLMRPDYDQRLDDPSNQKLVVRILGCVSTLFTDLNAPELQQRYGVEDVSSDPDSAATDRALTTRNRVGSIRWQNFIDDYMAHRSQLVKKTPVVTTVNKVRWIIRDRHKFEALIQELSHFSTKLNEILPAVSGGALSSRAMTDKDLEAISGIRELKVLIEASVGNRTDIAQSAEDLLRKRCRSCILNKLWFRRIDDRRESIRPAHKQTLQWLLNNKSKQNSWDDLTTWLRSSSGIYWVSGKAGSGKSTLMKHLYISDELQKLLSQWAGRERYFIGNFFFMNLGSREQKSQDGLSRTLLYQILSENPGIIPKALPHMWKELHDADNTNGPADISTPSLQETMHAFKVIAMERHQIGRFCFLIDGLDELTGNYMDGISFLKSLAAHPDIKVIVSSRPIPDCVAAFSHFPGLRLQDLNRTDISTYVDDLIGRHEYMKKIFRRSPAEGKQIIQDIIDKSSGVFLWVVLACRSLTDGFADHDNIAELRQRVDELPPELEQMFEHMLNTIKKRHREQGARLLRLFYTHQRIVHHLKFTRSMDETMFALGLALIDQHQTTPISIEYLEDDVKYDLCTDISGRLRSRCGGLLEVSTQLDCICSSDQCLQRPDGCSGAKVIFMHRTIFEFLDNDSTWELECLRLPKCDLFDPNAALSFYFLHLAKQSLYMSNSIRLRQKTATFLIDGLRFAGLADLQGSSSGPDTFFNNLHIIIQDPAFTKGRFASFHGLGLLASEVKEEKWHHEKNTQLRLAIEAGAVNYVKRHPGLEALVRHSNTSCSLEICQPLLRHAIRRPILDPALLEIQESDMTVARAISLDMIKLLLELGCRIGGDELLPNSDGVLAVDTAQGSLFRVLLRRIDSNLLHYSESEMQDVAHILEICLGSGASWSEFSSYQGKWARESGKEYALLLELLHSREIPFMVIGSSRQLEETYQPVIEESRKSSAKQRENRNTGQPEMHLKSLQHKPKNRRVPQVKVISDSEPEASTRKLQHASIRDPMFAVPGYRDLTESGFWDQTSFSSAMENTCIDAEVVDERQYYRKSKSPNIFSRMKAAIKSKLKMGKQ